MNERMGSGSPIDQEITGEPVEAHGYVVTPVAQVRGKAGSMDNEEGRGSWGWVAIRPVKASVVDRAGNTQELPIVNMQQRALVGMLAAGVVVAVVSLLVSLLVRAKRA